MISVIIPAYNAQKFIKDAIRSVLKQSYKDIEIIVINDGSTDKTDEICKQLANTNEKIRYFNKKNTGVSDTRNIGIGYAKGEYVFFMDSDDLLPENALSILENEMNKGDYDAVYGNFMYAYKTRNVKHISRIISGVYAYDDVKERLLDDGTLSGMLFGSVCGVLYKKSLIEQKNIQFNKKVKVNEDGMFNMIFIKQASKIKVTDFDVYIYRQWKTLKNEKLKLDKRYKDTEVEIQKYIKDSEDYCIYDKQLKCRDVSVAFWNALRVKNSVTNILEARKYLQRLFLDKKVREGLKYIDYSSINIYKRVMCIMMRYRMYLMFYIVVRYIYPVFERVLKR